MAVAAQGGLQPDDLGRVRLADQHGATVLALDQRHATQDQGPDQALAQVGLSDDQRAELAGRPVQRLYGPGCLGLHQRRLA